MPHLARHFIKLLPIVVATAVAACALGAPSDALAGMNGPQITACPSDAGGDYTRTVPKYNPFTNARRCETFDY
jgi:hypothetical protein